MIIEGIEGSVNLNKLYKELNQEYFGSLPTIKLSWSGKLKRAVGVAKVSYVRRKSSISKYFDEIPIADVELNMKSLSIGISKIFDLNMNDLKAVMLHEMVHIHLYTQSKFGDHHSSPEFQGWIRKLSGQSGLNIPMKESDFKSSPKLTAKEGYLILIWERTGEYGVSSYSPKFIQNNWMDFAELMGRLLSRSSKIAKIEGYKVKHPIVSSQGAKRRLTGISWTSIDEETLKEIQKKGTLFIKADKQGGEIKPKIIPMAQPRPMVSRIYKFDKTGFKFKEEYTEKPKPKQKRVAKRGSNWMSDFEVAVAARR